ncbi:hypothetical protein PENANT_c006G05263 [Penicillium antarcticum]|uniref:Uncharacterized protein n=2 Tax=Penicillium antarcticum TaxID=416450 RepID=A0A1V6QCQ4_9EURO|nr:hypothetical protein PENANT_c006G05263 [Penicillium antarcticum]
MHVDNKNCQAVLAFAFFLVVCSLGLEPKDEVLSLNNGNTQNKEQLSAQWIHILRNGCSMLCPVWDDLTSGPLAPFTALWRDDLSVSLLVRMIHYWLLYCPPS